MKPFEKEKQIRSGELPSWSYEELTGNLQVAPITWLPAIFKDDQALLRLVNKTVTDARTGTGMLRTEEKLP